jgi:hypothetical protein
VLARAASGDDRAEAITAAAVAVLPPTGPQ